VSAGMPHMQEPIKQSGKCLSGVRCVVMARLKLRAGTARAGAIECSTGAAQCGASGLSAMQPATVELAQRLGASGVVEVGRPLGVQLEFRFRALFACG